MSRSSKKIALELRRSMVADLASRGLTLRQIVEALTQRGVINPNTNEAWTPATVSNDLKALRKEWRDEALADIGEHMGRQYQELQTTKRAAWAKGDLKSVLRAVELEMRLLGTAQPDKLVVSHLSEDKAFAQMNTLLDKLESEVVEIDGTARPTDED